MIRKYKWSFIFFLSLIVILFSFYNINQVKHVNDQTDMIINEQTQILQSIKVELNESTTPIFHSYGKIKEVEGMGRILTSSNNKIYRNYGKEFLKMIKALEETFNTFTDNNFTTKKDRDFLSDHISLVLENMNKDSLGIADQVYARIMSETTEYYENYQKN